MILLNCDDSHEDDENEEDDQDEISKQPETGARNKRRCNAKDSNISTVWKKGRSGRAPKGKDWWSQVDLWFQQKRMEWARRHGVPFLL